MKKKSYPVLSVFLFFVLLFSFTVMCYAEEYDFSNMTTAELEELKDKIDDEINKNHKPDSRQKSSVQEVTKEYIEDRYGRENVEWAWVNYTYTKDWDFYTLSTHADIKKEDGGKAKYDIYSEVVNEDGKYTLVYITVGTEELVNSRSEEISDERILKQLGLKDGKEKKKNKKDADSNKDEEKKEASEEKDSKKEDVISISASDLYNEFDNNKIAAENKYKGKTVQVTGTVCNVDKDLLGTPFVSLDADGYGLETIMCSFSKSDEKELAALSDGQTVTIRGICDDMLFMSVSVDNCSLIQ